MSEASPNEDVSWCDLAAWVTARCPGTSVQDVRDRMESVFGWHRNADLLMRLPHPLLAGETPWDVLFYTPGGAARITAILDQVERGRLAVLPVRRRPIDRRRRSDGITL